MSRDTDERLADMRDACERISDFVARVGSDWANDPMCTDAIVRNLEILGEAAKHVPREVQDRFPTIPWGRIGGLRDILIHQYFGVDVLVLRSVVETHIPALRQALDAASD